MNTVQEDKTFDLNLGRKGLRLLGLVLCRERQHLLHQSIFSTYIEEVTTTSTMEKERHGKLLQDLSINESAT